MLSQRTSNIVWLKNIHLYSHPGDSNTKPIWIDADVFAQSEKNPMVMHWWLKVALYVFRLHWQRSSTKWEPSKIRRDGLLWPHWTHGPRPDSCRRFRPSSLRPWCQEKLLNPVWNLLSIKVSIWVISAYVLLACLLAATVVSQFLDSITEDLCKFVLFLVELGILSEYCR